MANGRKTSSWPLLSSFTPEDSTRFQLHGLPGGELVTVVHAPAAISPSGEQVAASSPNNHLCLFYEVGGYEQGAELGMDFRMWGTPEFSPDGSWLVWATTEGWILVADLGEVKRRLMALGWTPH